MRGGPGAAPTAPQKPGRVQPDGNESSHSGGLWLRTDPDARRLQGPTRHVRTCSRSSDLTAASDQDSSPHPSPLPGTEPLLSMCLLVRVPAASLPQTPFPGGRGRSGWPPVPSHQEPTGNQEASWRAMPSGGDRGLRLAGGRGLSHQGHPPPRPSMGRQPASLSLGVLTLLSPAPAFRRRGAELGCEVCRVGVSLQTQGGLSRWPDPSFPRLLCPPLRSQMCPSKGPNPLGHPRGASTCGCCGPGLGRGSCVHLGCPGREGGPDGGPRRVQQEPLLLPGAPSPGPHGLGSLVRTWSHQDASACLREAMARDSPRIPGVS